MLSYSSLASEEGKRVRGTGEAGQQGTPRPPPPPPVASYHLNRGRKMPRSDETRRAMRPRLLDRVGDDICPWNCAFCGTNLRFGEEIRDDVVMCCECTTCVWYSEVCREEDAACHADGCARVQALSEGLNRIVTSLEELIGRMVPRYFFTSFPDIFDRDTDLSCWIWFRKLNESDKKLLTDTREQVFTSKVELIEALVQEGCRRDGTNEIALYLAIQSCKDLLHLNYSWDCSLSTTFSSNLSYHF